MTTENKKPGRILDYDKKLPILELYTCIQSEGSRQGRPTVAVRTTARYWSCRLPRYAKLLGFKTSFSGFW